MNDFTFSKRHGVATLELTRPGDGNLLSLDALSELSVFLKRLAKEADVRVLVVRGQGANFCLGRAPGKFAGETADEFRTALIDPILDVYTAIRGLDFPVVGAVQGAAAGLGCALVSCCDIAIADDTARFSLPEMTKDLPPTLAVSALASKVHPKTVAAMVLGLMEIDAPTALSVGLVSEVCRPDALSQRVDNVALQIASRQPVALAAIKKYLRAVTSPEHEVRAELAGSILAGAMSTIKARAKGGG